MAPAETSSFLQPYVYFMLADPATPISPAYVVGCHLLCLGSVLARGGATTLCTDLPSATFSIWHFYNQCLFNSFRQVIWLECESKVLSRLCQSTF